MYDYAIPDDLPTHGDIKKKRIAQFLNIQDFKIFVETGTYKGNGVSWGIENNFNVVYSTEIYRPLYDECVERFKGNQIVKLYNLDTVNYLNEVVPTLNSKTVFFS